MRNWITQISMLQYTDGNVWPECGLAAFSPSLYKIKSGSGTMRSEVSLFGCLRVNSFWKTRDSTRGKRHCSIKSTGGRHTAEGSPPYSFEAMSTHKDAGEE